MKRIYALIAAGSCLAVAIPAAVSATVFKTVTLDLSTGSYSADHSSFGVTGLQFPDLAIANHETLDLTVLFSGTQSISVVDIVSIGFALTSSAGSPAAGNISGSGQMTLFSTPNQTSSPTNYNYTSSNAGQTLDAETRFTPELPSPITFTGIHYVGTVNYSSGAATRSYYIPSLTVSGDSANAVTTAGQAAAAVPEPASWALMVIGFGAVGGALRRRTVRVSTQLNLR